MFHVFLRSTLLGQDWSREGDSSRGGIHLQKESSLNLGEFCAQKRFPSFESVFGAQLCCCCARMVQLYQRTIADKHFNIKFLREDDWYSGCRLVDLVVPGFAFSRHFSFVQATEAAAPAAPAAEASDVLDGSWSNHSTILGQKVVCNCWGSWRSQFLLFLHDGCDSEGQDWDSRSRGINFSLQHRAHHVLSLSCMHRKHIRNRHEEMTRNDKKCLECRIFDMVFLRGSVNFHEFWTCMWNVLGKATETPAAPAEEAMWSPVWCIAIARRHVSCDFPSFLILRC